MTALFNWICRVIAQTVLVLALGAWMYGLPARVGPR